MAYLWWRTCPCCTSRQSCHLCQCLGIIIIGTEPWTALDSYHACMGGRRALFGPCSEECEAGACNRVDGADDGAYSVRGRVGVLDQWAFSAQCSHDRAPRDAPNPNVGTFQHISLPCNFEKGALISP